MKVYLLIVLALSVHLTAVQAQQCPPDAPYTNCLVDPCTTSTCPLVPTATCRADYCGGCHARWYVSGGIEVTRNCTGPCAAVSCVLPNCLNGAQPITPQGECCSRCPNTTQSSCPVPSSGTTGACVLACSDDSSCPGSQLCCSNGCGRVCMDPVVTTTSPPAVTCTGLNGQRYQPGDTYTAADGCNTCTCTSTGVSACTRIACPPTCTDQAGNRYFAGQSFPAADGCNNCTCTSSGAITCTLRACLDICSLPPETGPCDALFPSFYYNRSTSRCERFIYGGCRGNQNRFSTADDCYRRCNQSIITTTSPPAVTCTGPNGQRYQPGDTYTAADGCNTCTCTSTGVSACTLIGCPPTCTDEAGNRHFAGQSFPAADGCNNCTCTSTGAIACTRRACLDICSLPPESGVCLAYFPSFYYNPRTSLCESFVYGGCGGNQNRFRTAGECYRRCNPSSQCVQPTYPDDFDVLCLVVQRKWAFNPNTSRCEGISYSPCGQEREGYNVFDSEAECNRTCVRAEETCPPGVPIVRCLADPCTVSSCPGVPNARCEANYCGGCNAFYYSENGNNITDRCSIPSPQLASVCPRIEEGSTGLCVQGCSDNNGCQGDQICCSNGCGRSCVDPDRIPYYDIPRQCPSSEDSDLTTGTCVLTNASCLTSDQCDNGELCCQSGCGRRCTRSVVPTQPCTAVANQFRLLNRTLSGHYTPQCDATNGTFRPYQCHPSTGYCWCTNTRTGQPISGFYPRGVQPNCTTCSYNSRIYNVGDSFPSSDGCNICGCSENGFVFCTERACIDTCSLPPETGPCRAAIPAYYFDRSRGACLPFIYGGCRGNDNKFQTIADCLRRCNPQSRCLRAAPICIDTFNSSVDTGHYTFNSTSGRCNRFPSGCTALPIFPNQMECQNCNPGSVPDPCATVRCARPNCTEDRWVTDPGACCARCRPPAAVECDENEFRCSDSECIPSHWVCDGLRDCDNGRDETERQCPRNGTCLGHSCGDGVCIPSDYVCDNYLDCRDASDEANCTSVTFENTYYPDQLPSRCPNSTSLIGSCSELCSSDNPCDDNLLCCSNGCGRSCMLGQTVAPLCPALLRQSGGRIGAFVPECERDGSFSTIQCWGSTGFCWCVESTSGRPISEGIRGQPDCPGCTVDDVTYPYGERFTAEDGCNTCYCSSSGVAVCTREACAPVSCMLLDKEVPHGQTLDEECFTCMCRSGQLNCTRKKCARTGAVTQKPPTRVVMGYDGNLDQLTPTDDNKDELKREVMKTLLNRYKDRLGLIQEQISNIELMKDDGISIGVTITESQNTSTGADVAILVGQMQQDYQSKALVIRYNRAVLEPSGDFQVDEGAETGSGSASFPWWGILIVVLGAVVLVTAVSVVIMTVVIKGKGRPTYAATGSNDYSQVVYKKSESDQELKLPLDEDGSP